MGRRAAVLLGGGVCLLLVGLVVGDAIPVRSGDVVTPDAGVRSTPSVWPVAPDPWSGPPLSPWWTGTAASELVPTEVELVNTTGVDSMVVDGAGAVWVHGTWQLAHVDPETGSAQTWDASDDAAFATTVAIRPSTGAGVWLIDDDRLRLFDGLRFVRDLPVPAEFRGGEDAAVSDLAEVGTEVWVGSAAGVARCTQWGAWSMVGRGSIRMARELTVDSEGRVWSVGRVPSEGDSGHVLVRFDRGLWRTLEGTGAPRFAEEVVADPTGGVLTRLGLAVRRFDGASWRSIPLLPPAQFPLIGAAHTMSAGLDGSIWVLGRDGPYRYEDPGGWHRTVRRDHPALVGLGMWGSDVLVADGTGLLRLDDDRMAGVWTSRGPGLGLPVAEVLVVSADEIWATGDDVIWKFHDGRWWRKRSGLGWRPATGAQRAAGARLARATDGAVWAITDGGLARFDGDEQVLVPSPVATGWLLPGPGGAVWAVEAILSGWSTWYAADHWQAGSVSLVRVDRTQPSVRLPGPAWSLSSLAAGPDGTIWVTICQRDGFDYCTLPALMRWDGRWSHVPYPGSGVSAVSASPDGGFWALITDVDTAGAPPTVTRYMAGTWTAFPELPDLQSVAADPRGGLCGIDPTGPSVVCLDPSGRVRSQPVPVTGVLRIGTDGSLWVEHRGVVARLPGTAPGWQERALPD